MADARTQRAKGWQQQQLQIQYVNKQATMAEKNFECNCFFRSNANIDPCSSVRMHVVCTYLCNIRVCKSIVALTEKTVRKIFE